MRGCHAAGELARTRLKALRGVAFRRELAVALLVCQELQLHVAVEHGVLRLAHAVG